MRNLKQIIVLLAIFFSAQFATCTVYASNNLRQDSLKITTEAGRQRTVFYVYAPASQDYHIKFWVMGVEHYGYPNSSYKVFVDNSAQLGSICPPRGDWCMCKFPNSIYLTEGTHEIILEGTPTDLPNAEKVESYNPNQQQNGFIGLNQPTSLPYDSTFPRVTNYTDSACYERMKRHLPLFDNNVAGDTLNNHYRYLQYHPIENDPLYPPLHYTADLNKIVYYTFYRLDYYTGNEINVTVDLTNRQCVVHVFSRDNANFSATSGVLDESNNYYSCQIPNDGYYYVMVRAYSQDDWGTCDVKINNKIFENVPLNCSRTIIESPSSEAQYACFAKGDDPIIFLMDQGLGGGILAFNDDYSSTLSNYDWGNNARIDGQLEDEQWILTLVKSYPSRFYKKCDIYTRCEKICPEYYTFPNYAFDDALMSSDATLGYNCVSWAVGEWTINPVFSTIEDDNLYMDSVMTYYGYHVVANENSSTVDLWATHNLDGSYKYTHYSVKAKSHPYAAGYDWESKLADSWRMFHPRYALTNENGWGSVIKYYRKDNVVIGPVYLNINIEQNEFEQIEDGIRLVSQHVMDSFSNLYSICKKNGILRPSLYIDTYENVNGYTELLDYCSKNPLCHYLLYKNICEGDVLSIKLLKDLTLSGEKADLWREAVDYVKKACRERKDSPCIHNAQSYAMCLIKLLLYDGDEKCLRPSSISYSDSPKFNVRTNGKQIIVTFDLENDAFVSLLAGNVEGTSINSIVNLQCLSKGSYSYSYQATRAGSYVVGLKVNGATYKKTIYVK